MGNRIHATGGGAYKYTELFEQEFTQRGVQVLKHDEMASLVHGLSFVLKYANKSSSTVDGSPTGDCEGDEEVKESDFPKLLVSIGSGVSMIKVSEDDSYVRVGGTMIGGGTLLGLSTLMTGIKNFDSIIEKAQTGQNTNVDMVVSDIYGENSPFKELRGDLLASSFAKAAVD